MISEDIQQAEQLIGEGRIDEAVSLLGKVLRRDPCNEKIFFLLSECVEDPKKKTTYLRRILEINPRNNDAKRALNEIKEVESGRKKKTKVAEKKQRKMKGAITSDEKATKEKPEEAKPKERKPIEIAPRPPTMIYRNSEEDFFYGCRTGVHPAARLETGLYGKNIIVNGIQLFPDDLPACVQSMKFSFSDGCENCEFFSPGDCLLRFDEDLIREIYRFTTYRYERQRMHEERRQTVVETLYKELKAHGRPLHYTAIARIMIGRHSKLGLNTRAVLRYLLKNPDKFIRMNEGVFAAKKTTLLVRARLSSLEGV